MFAHLFLRKEVALVVLAIRRVPFSVSIVRRARDIGEGARSVGRGMDSPSSALSTSNVKVVVPPAKADNEQNLDEGLVDTYFNRLVGWPLTDLFIHRKTTTNTVTALSAATGCCRHSLFLSQIICSASLRPFCFRRQPFSTAAMAMSPGAQVPIGLGETLDLLSGYVCYATMFFAIGWRVSQSAGTGMDSIAASLRRSPAD